MEFKKLSDVEVVESVNDAANVLIEENGVIKKVSKTQIGGVVGTGSAEPDMVLLTSIYEGTPDDISVIQGTVNNVFDAVRSGRQPVVKIQIRNGADDYEYATRYEGDARVYLYGEMLVVYYLSFVPSAIYINTITINSDNSIDWINTHPVGSTS